MRRTVRLSKGLGGSFMVMNPGCKTKPEPGSNADLWQQLEQLRSDTAKLEQRSKEQDREIDALLEKTRPAIDFDHGSEYADPVAYWDARQEDQNDHD